MAATTRDPHTVAMQHVVIEEAGRKELTEEQVIMLQTVMNYHFAPVKCCRTCIFCVREHGDDDESWLACTRPHNIELPSFRVNESAVCDHHKV